MNDYDDARYTLLAGLADALGLDLFMHYQCDSGCTECALVGQSGVPDSQLELVSAEKVGASLCCATTAAGGRLIERLDKSRSSEYGEVFRSLSIREIGSWSTDDAENRTSILCLAAMREVTESQSRFSDIAVNVMELVCEALRMSDEEAVRRADQVRRLVLQLSESEERERRRIADLLHDELQQNLAGVKVHVDMALRHAENDTYLSERLSTANELLREVVEVSRSLSHELRPANIKSRGLIAALGSMASQMEAAHGLTVEISTTGTIPRLSETVEVIVFRSVRELLFNVAKHADVDSATVQLRAEPEGLKLTVRDHGRGFDADAVLESGEGNGLGLISLRERIEAIGGSVSIDSTPGKGSRFTLLVPIPVTGSADRSVSGAADEGYATAESDRREPITVLLVDDHAVIRQGLAMLLNEEPDLSVVAEADSGAHAIEAVRRLRPMVVVMDYTMPGMEGDEATRAIKREFPQTHVIGLSMHAGSDAPERMLEAGADVYLPKTGPSENVIAAIRRVTS